MKEFFSKKNLRKLIIGQSFLFVGLMSPLSASAALSVACFGSPLEAQVGEPVSWTALAAGGSDDYLFNWTGSESLFGSLPTVHKIYNTPGVKSANVSVYSSFSPLAFAYDSCQITVQTPPTAPAVQSTFETAVAAGAETTGQVLGARVLPPLKIEFSRVWIIFSWFLLALVAGIFLALFFHHKFKTRRARRQSLAIFRKDEKHQQAAQIVEQEARRQGILISEDALKEIVEQTEGDSQKAVLAFRQIASQLEAPICLVEGEQGCSIVDKLLVEKHFLARRHSLEF